MTMPPGKLINSVAYCLALAITVACGIARFLLLPNPAIGRYQLAIVPVVVASLVIWAMCHRWQMRLRVLGWAAISAGLALSTSLIVGNLPPYSVFHIPTPNIIGPAFHLDGEAAYDAGMYELWCEVWFVLALIGTGLFVVAKRNFRFRRD